MLIKESMLAVKMTNNLDSILESALCLTEEESVYHPAMIPVVENGRLGANVVRLDDLTRLVESHFEYGYLDALNMVSEANGIDAKSLKVAANEYELIEDADLAHELIVEGVDLVVAPISESNPIYVMMETAVNAYAMTGDEDILEYMAMTEAGRKVRGKDPSDNARLATDTQYYARKAGDTINTAKEKVGNAYEDLKGKFKAAVPSSAGDVIDKAKDAYHTVKDQAKDTLDKAGNAIKDNPKMAAGVALGAAVAGGAGYAYAQKVEREAESKPKSWISQKIAALRALYSKWLAKANKETDSGKASSLKNVAAKIMNVIDRLMKKLQTATA